MRKIICIAFLYCCPLLVIAQNNTIKGKVKDSLNHPVPLVHVMVFQTDIFVGGTITDSLGNFTMTNLEEGSYDLNIAAMGFQDFTKEFSLSGDNLDLGVLQLKTESIALDGVELVGRKKMYQKKANSLVINVEQNIASSGGSALDLLSNAAGVAVNQQNGALSLSNNGKISIMINGKVSRVDGQALISLLKSMPVSDIKTLEIFNNPPAKYEANGSGGMINIATKSKNNDGQGGSVSLNGGYGKGEKTGASLNFHFKQGKTGWFGSYAFNRNRTPEEWKLQSRFNNPLSQKTVLTTSHRKPIINAHNYSFGIESALLKNTTFGVNLSGYNSNWNMVAFDKVIRNGNTSETETLNIKTRENNQWNHLGGSLFLEQSLGDWHILTLEYTHLYYNYDNPSSYDSPEPIDFAEVQKQTPITFNVFNADYSGVISENIRFEFGAKTTSSNFTNDIVVSSSEGGSIVIDDELSSTTQMDEQIHGIYASFEFQFGEKTSLNTGLRFEHTKNKLDIDKSENTINRTYNNLFPNLVFNHQINDEHHFQVSYGRRINRPTFDNLAPYVLFLGPEALYSGNANLQPSFVHKIGTEWRWAEKYISLEYLIEKDPIAEFQPRISSNGEQYIFKAENMDLRNMLNASLRIPFSITSWWQNETSFTYQYEVLQFYFQETDFNRSKGSFRATSSQQFSLGEKTKMELNGYYQSSTLFGISTSGARGSLNIGIQQQLKKNHGTLKLSFSNMFASDNWKIRTSHEQPFINTLETYFPESRILAFTYTKNLGGSNKAQKYKRNSADEEKMRVQ